MDHHAALGCDMVLLLGLQGYDTSTELNVRIAHERRISFDGTWRKVCWQALPRTSLRVWDSI